MFSRLKLLFILFISSIVFTGCSGDGDNPLIDMADKASGGMMPLIGVTLIILFIIVAVISDKIRKNKKKGPPPPPKS